MATRRAGTRRHLIELQRPERVVLTTGFRDDWVTYALVWASVTPVAPTPVDLRLTTSLQVPVSHLVEIDARADVHATHRVRLDEMRLLFVQGWQNVDERDKTMVLACEERF